MRAAAAQSQPLVFGTDAVCLGGGLDIASASYQVCLLQVASTVTFLVTGSVCAASSCDDGTYVKVWVNP